MATRSTLAAFVVDQMGDAGEIVAKKMFGEYGLYCNGVFFGLICDDRVFVKPTASGREWIGDPVEAPPYPNAKGHFLIDDPLDNRPWVGELVRRTVQELAATAAKSPRRKK